MKYWLFFFFCLVIVSPTICVLSYAKTDLEYGKKTTY